MIAQSKASGSKLDFSDDTALNRLFVVCPKSYNEDDLRCKFQEFGDIDYVQIVRDHTTKDPKGFGYVKFTKASTAAVALENCDKTLKAVIDRKSTRLNSSHANISYAVFCLKKKNNNNLTISYLHFNFCTRPT